MADTALEIAELLAGLGFDSPPLQERARAVLAGAGLTRPGKVRIDASKRERVEAVLAERFLVTCGAADCERQAAGRELLRAESARACRICAGSANRRAFVAAEQALARKNLSKLVIVGGAPAVHDELLRQKPAGWSLRIVVGTDRRTLDQARNDARWADVVLIWGGTELDHKVSELYTRETPRERLVLLNRRGIAALLDEAVKHASRR